MTRMSDVQEFEFDLMIALPVGERDEDAMLDALFEAGCDDAIVGTGAAGIVSLGFIREGSDAEAVIAKAVGQALKGLPEGACLREVRPDLVSLADVAARLQVSRQALQKPPPSLGGLYRVTEMIRYLEAQPGKIRDGVSRAAPWFAAAPAAQKINAQLGLSD
jgi:hypothetical protein